MRSRKYSVAKIMQFNFNLFHCYIFSYLRCSLPSCHGTAKFHMATKEIEEIFTHDDHCEPDEEILDRAMFKAALKNTVQNGYVNLKDAYDTLALV